MAASSTPPVTTNGHTDLTSGASQAPNTSQTAQDYIASQVRLEADAREALPYQFDTCTKPLGPLRQSVFACLTCTPPPATPHQQFTPAGVCYSCSISCHGDHNLVELFAKRNFVCDCGTTRFSNSETPCSLRFNAETGRKGGVSGDDARQGNQYNQNFRGRFCGCGEEYDPEKEKGTMFQCLGLGTGEGRGCGEDWWHPECLMGLPRVKGEEKPVKPEMNGALEDVKEEEEDATDMDVTTNPLGEPTSVDEAPPPPGFPNEDDFDHLICYKCADDFPWIKQYAGTPGFLLVVSADGGPSQPSTATDHTFVAIKPLDSSQPLKRKAETELEESQSFKRNMPTGGEPNPSAPLHKPLPSPPSGSITLFLQEDFRDHLCRCPDCFPSLTEHPQLLEEEDSYEPPLSESDDARDQTGRSSVHSGSVLERGEAALSTMDRVRAIEGVTAYNHVRDKVKEFLQPFAESGQAVGAEDIKAHFAKLRGEMQAAKDAQAGSSMEGEGGDQRREQGGY